MAEHTTPFRYPTPSVLAEIARTQIAYVRAVERLRCLCSELIAGLSTAAFPVIRRLPDSALVEVTIQVARERLAERQALLGETVAAIGKLGAALADRNSLVHDEISPLGGEYGADFSVTAFKKSGLRDERFSEQETWWDEATLREYRERLEGTTHEIDALRIHKLDYGRIHLAARSRPSVISDEIVWRTATRRSQGLRRGTPLPKATQKALEKEALKRKRTLEEKQASEPELAPKRKDGEK